MLIELSKGLQAMDGCKCTVGVIRNSQNPNVDVSEEAKKEGLSTVIFPCRNRFDLQTIFEIQKFLRESKVNLIHCHGYKANFYGLFASRGKIPAVTTHHNWLRWHWRLGLYCLLDSLWIRYFDRVITVSDKNIEELLRYRIPKAKIRVIDNGIDMDRFSREIQVETIKKELGLLENSKVVGTIGRLGDEKGQIYLLRAAQGVVEREKSVRFLIVGDGPLREYLKEETAKLGIADSVTFTGYRQDIPELLSVMDLFVLPSIKEALPMVLLEALAARKAVIATRVGAIPKVVNNENGMLVEPGDAAGLQDAILSLLANEEKRQGYASAGYDTVKTYFSSERMSSEYIDLYNELLGDRLL
jgi:glycosyltransferase involved in cell wall biosynthesis